MAGLLLARAPMPPTRVLLCALLVTAALVPPTVPAAQTTFVPL